MSHGTPLQAWPTRKFRGSPGCSARHYAALAGAPDDPLRVAERIASRADRERIHAEFKRKLAAGEDFEAALEWQHDEIGRVSQETWARLCASFDDVIAALESVPQTPGMKTLVKQVKTAKRRVA